MSAGLGVSATTFSCSLPLSLSFQAICTSGICCGYLGRRPVPVLCRALGLVLWLVAWAQLPRLLLRCGPEALRSWVLIPWKGRAVLWKRRSGLGWEVWLLPCLRSLVKWMFGAELSVVSVMYGCVVAQWELHRGDYSKKKKKKRGRKCCFTREVVCLFCTIPALIFLN